VLKNLVAVGAIFCGASLAWLILGSTLVARTEDSRSKELAALGSQWGSAQTQQPPTISARIGNARILLPIVRSRIAVGLNLEQRRKGLLWYNLYNVQFDAHYVAHNVRNAAEVAVDFTLPSSDATYTDYELRVNGRRIDTSRATTGGDERPAGRRNGDITIDVTYRSRGNDAWMYEFADKGVATIRDFDLAMTTNFGAIDFPPQTLSPTQETKTRDGWTLHWTYGTLLTGNGIGMTVPYPLQPGPLAERITFWAPVSLLFYIFVMLLITTIRGVDLHPMNYFFLACAFFSFHLLLAYLVDRIPLEAAFTICSVVSLFLTITYLRLVVGWRFAAIEGGFAQLIYLVLFSWALFNEGWSGLTITIGAVITLFLAMQLTGRIRWSERFAATR
jgi:hypothetical protein